jgi:hypothetical protein
MTSPADELPDVDSMKHIIGFGDSFVFGTELANNQDGHQSWIGQAAKKLGVGYHTSAVPGCGNDHIARQIYSWFAKNPVEDTLAVINWTWTMRWDFYIVEHETWITLGPSCVPEKLKDLVERTEAEDMIAFYKHRANSSLIWNKIRNLQTIWAVQCYMKTKGINAIQTYMDYELFNRQSHAPDYMQELQTLVEPSMQNFEDLNFVDWSKKHGYWVTSPGMHPLEQAHSAACELWVDRYRQALDL